MDTGKDGQSLTQGVMLYVHLECLAALLARLERERATIQPDRLRFWEPEELIGRYTDITGCDQCGKTFAPTDRGYSLRFGDDPPTTYAGAVASTRACCWPTTTWGRRGGWPCRASRPWSSGSAF